MTEVALAAGERPSGASLDDLVCRVSGGDVDAFDTLYAELYDEVLRVAVKVVRDHGFAEDVTQEVFAWLWREAGRFDPACGSARAWVFTVTRRRAVDCVRREVGWRQCGVIDVAHHYDPHEDFLVAWERTEHVASLMTTLTALQHAAVMLAFMGEHTYPRAAEILNVKASTFKSRVHDALLRMRLAVADGVPAFSPSRG